MVVLRALRGAWLVVALVASIMLTAVGGRADAAEDALARGWTLDPQASSLKFQSIKNGTTIETSSFASFEGVIAPDGAATVAIRLESVDTGVDLRNVRMRFLFFETFLHPQATVRLTLDPAQLTDLATARRKTVRVAYDLDLHGVVRRQEADVVATLLDEGRVSVASAGPITVRAADHALEEGILKLQDAAKVTIIPAASVTFDFVFTRNADPEAAPRAKVAAPEPAAAIPAAASAALEAPGEFSVEACLGRFEILSRAGAIYFRSGSADLDPASAPALGAVADVIRRCPALNVEVAGHTDSVGADELNRRLSEARAQSVAAALASSGIEPARIRATGYGESRPAYPNDSARNRALNRRIEFVAAAPL